MRRKERERETEKREREREKKCFECKKGHVPCESDKDLREEL